MVLQQLKQIDKSLFVIVVSVLVIAWWFAWWTIFDKHLSNYCWYIVIIVPLLFYVDDYDLSELYEVPEDNGKT